MNRKHILIIGISGFLLFYFLVPVVGVEWGCQSKDHPPPDVFNARAGWTVGFSLGIYTIIFLNGGHLETDHSICSWD